jgi:predicted DNA-binding transcriptional regulator YafY
MSYLKADQLMQLATLMSSRHRGVTLDQVKEEFDVSHRTAQRMMRAIEQQFPEVQTSNDEQGHKRWRIGEITFKDLITVKAEELAALELGIKHLQRDGLKLESHELEILRDKIKALIPRAKLRIEADHDAILEAQGFVARPGPRPKMDQDVYVALIEAIKSCRFVTFSYKSVSDKSMKQRYVAPYGFLSGIRRYLIAYDPKDKRGSVLKTYRVDVIENVKVSEEYFIRPQDFDLKAFADQAFGVFQRNGTQEDVVWRFIPEAAPHAAGYLFHPSQTEEYLPDGSLIIRFRATGLLEMAWHLYTWGDKVEVVEPKALRDMISKHKRSDFPAMP